MVVPLVVPTSITEAPGSGLPLLSVTFPLIVVWTISSTASLESVGGSFDVGIAFESKTTFSFKLYDNLSSKINLITVLSSAFSTERLISFWKS